LWPEPIKTIPNLIRNQGDSGLGSSFKEIFSAAS
jgi:hypothetical protein